MGISRIIPAMFLRRARDVDTTGVADGDTLVWNASTETWEVGDAAVSTPNTIYPEDYGALGDVVHITDGSMSSSVNPTQLSSLTYTFTAADIGKLVSVENVLIVSPATGNTTNPIGVGLGTIISVAGGIATLSFSATVTNTAAKVSFGTDDTAALTAFFAALSAAPSGLIYTGILSSQYAVSAAVSDGGGSYQLRSTGMSAVWEMDLAGSAIPQGPSVQKFPYIRGACIVAFATSLTAIVTSSGNGQVLNWEGIGLRYARQFALTNGHGHQAMGPVVPSQVYHRSGCIQSKFDNVAVFGHGGNSYALRHVNSYHNQYRKTLSSGGGHVSNHGDNPIFNWGNHTWIDPEAHTFLAGTAHNLDVTVSNGASQILSCLVHPNFFVSNLAGNFYPTAAGATTAQKFLAMPPSNSIAGFSVIAPDFESPSLTGTQSQIDWATGAAGLAANSGFWFDPGHFIAAGGAVLKAPQYQSITTEGVTEFAHDQHRHITATTDTMGAGMWSARYSTYDTTSGSCTVTLPSANSTKPTGELVFMKVSSDGNTVTINAGGANKFYNSSGPTSMTLTTQGASLHMIWNGQFWMPFQA